MHIHKTKKLIKVALYASIIACAAGAATGTFAWYSYQKDVATNILGTTIKADKEIQVGLRSDSELDLESVYTLGEIQHEENVSFENGGAHKFHIYWIRGNYFSEILSTFHQLIGAAYGGQLRAITAGAYTAGQAEDIGEHNGTAGAWNGFKKTPSSKQSEWVHGGLVDDSKRDMFYLPLAFRALSNERGEGDTDVYLPDVEIFLTEFETHDLDAVSGTNLDLSHSIRCKVDYPSNDNTSKNYIFDPNAAADKNLEVGGPLNLNFDPYYDYVASSAHEIPYGEWQDNVAYESEPTSVQGTLDILECTTFEANHKVGIKQIASGVRAATCQTYKREKAVNGAKTENANKSIAVTNCYKNYGYVDLSIYLEGWDRNIVNAVSGNRTLSTDGHAFSIALEFSIN